MAPTGFLRLMALGVRWVPSLKPGTDLEEDDLPAGGWDSEVGR